MTIIIQYEYSAAGFEASTKVCEHPPKYFVGIADTKEEAKERLIKKVKDYIANSSIKLEPETVEIEVDVKYYLPSSPLVLNQEHGNSSIKQEGSPI